ncbi:MAG: Lrp/AsnC family transcriptional regulator [Candidatus Thorarchaeota archaeon]|nr:Lrp/AsnC family transcriptional regulator [Candidatus Thorarchaeota archaeon]
MDLVDKTIMVEVSSNCRVSYETLSQKTGLSANAVKNRVNALLDTGTISRFAISLEAAMIDASHFMALVKTNGTEDIDAFVGQLGENPMIGHVSILASAGGGAYLVWGQYIGTNMLPHLRAFLRTPTEVEAVELHTIIDSMGKKVKFSKLHLRILSFLKKNPRALISDISQEAGLAPKTVRRAIRELTEGGGIRFTARPDMAAGKLVNFYVRFEWNENEVTTNKVVTWLREKYPVELWDPTISASEPVIFAEFVVENLHEAEEIARHIRSKSFVKSTTTLVSYSSQKFPYFAESMLDEMVREAGF